MEATVPVRRVALIVILALSVWAGAATPKLERSAASAPLGLWRDVQLALLRPFHHAPEPRATAPADDPSVAPDLPARREIATARPTPRPGPRRPTAADPLRVLAIGDSLGKDLAYGLVTMARDDPTLAITADARPATGLSRPDSFDWPAQLARDIAVDRPELVVVMLGGDDAQPFELDGHAVAQDTPEWTTAYTARVDAFLRAASADGRPVLWVGLPVMRDDAFSARMRALNAIYAAAAERAGVRFIDTWLLFADRAGRYAPFLPGPDGVMRSVRQVDGIHFSVDGALRAGAAVRAAIAEMISSSSAQRSLP